MTDEQTSTAPAVPAMRIIANRYRLGGELGRGGMGVVWRAEDTVIGRQVAIKELRLPDGAEEGVFQERVLREVRTGGRLNDPAVVTVFDVVAESGTTYIVMELVEAPTLSDLVRRNGPLPPHQIASIGLQVLSALRAAHQAGIVHRDVKPANIMVAANGRTKLTDFGIAQAIDDPRITTSGMLVGSPAFMAPERVAGTEAIPASDLWSLGAALFFAVEGAVPFERASTAATLHAIMNEVPYLTRVHGPLASAIMGLLATSPEGRISADQAHHLLTLAAHQQPAVVTPPGGQPTLHHGPSPTLVAGRSAAPATATATTPGRKKALWTAGALAGVGLLVAGFFLGKPVWSPGVDEQMLPTLTYGRGGDIEELAIYSTSHRCINTTLDEGRSIGQSNWVDCEEYHDVEWYGEHRLVGGSDELGAPEARYPGHEEFARYAETVCGLTFHSNLVEDSVRGTLAYRALIPSRQEWEQSPSDDIDGAVRNVYCFVGNKDGGQRVGSVVQEVA